MYLYFVTILCMYTIYLQGGHYSWKLLECNLTPGETPGKAKNFWKTPGERSCMCVLPNSNELVEISHS